MLLPLFECVHKSNIFTATDTTHPYEGDRWSNLLKKKNTHFCQKKRKKLFGEQTKIFSVLPLSTRRPRTGAKRFFSSRLVNRQSIDQFIASVLRRVHNESKAAAIVKLSSGWTWSLRVQRLDSFSFSSFVKVSWFSIENNDDDDDEDEKAVDWLFVTTVQVALELSALSLSLPSASDSARWKHTVWPSLEIFSSKFK